MKRRKYLATLGTGALAVGAGCLDFSSGFKIEQIRFEDLRENPSAIFDATVEFNGEVIMDEEINVGDREPASHKFTDLPEETGNYDINVSVPNVDDSAFSYPPEEGDVADCVVLRLSIENSGSDSPIFYPYDYTCEEWNELTS